MGFLWGFRWSFGLRYYRDPAEGPQRRESWKARPLPWYAMRRTELANRLLICAQAFGEALDLTGWSASAATRPTCTASSTACSPY